MNHISFGSLLKEARVKHGYELTEVSRRLRIRPDILQAIERSDFHNMPPTGYARNMIGAYARLVGLDPAEIINLYHDEAYAFQIGQANRNLNSRYQQRNTSRATSRPSAAARRSNGEYSSQRSTEGGRARYSANGERTNNLGRRLYTDQAKDYSQNLYDESTLHRSRRPILTEGKYGNLVSGGSKRNLYHRSIPKVPLIIGAAVVVLLVLILFMVNACSHRNEEPQSIPVTGVESTQDNQEQQAQLPTAPTSFAFAYSLAEGSESWIEVYIDDTLQEAGQLSGPTQGQYACSSTLRFVSSRIDGVSVTIDGVAQELTTNENGIITVTYSFEDILNQWYTDHPEVPRPGTTTTTTNQTATQAGSSTGTQNTQTAQPQTAAQNTGQDTTASN